jgi:predicted glycosyltransferase
MGGELLGALEYLRKEMPSTPVILGLRDIIDDEESVIQTFQKDDIYRVVENYYDNVFVYGMESVYDPGVRYRFPASVRRKMQFMGYLYRNGVVSPEDRSKLAPQTGRLVVVTVGGGADGENVIRAFLQALASSTGRGRFDSVIVTGPLMAPETRAELEASALQDSLPVRFVTFSRNVLDLFAAANVVVSMGGYNTLCEVLALGKKSVVIPRTSPRREQLIRARRFEELGLVDCLDPRDLEPGSLLAAVDKALIESESPGASSNGAVALDFGGLSRVSRELSAALQYNLGAACGHRGSR